MACLKRLSETGLAPRLRATGEFANQAWALYDHAPGAPWRTNPRRAAEALAMLHALKPGLKLPEGCNGSRDLTCHTEEILSSCTPSARAEIEALRPDGPAIAAGRTCLIHGDPVPGNLLFDGDGVVLIDWQCPAIGDPAEDIAIFLSPAMQHVYRGKALTHDEEQAFLAAYADPEITGRYRALEPWFHWRMAAYCLWRAQNGAPDYAPAYRLEAAALTR
ncbi:Phosphotransferase enzyme family protein [Ruegeria marina]|uniref:Phosphotransferase enzyme family protein n=2 Tax=Ruegeria marina TaxID=639004 RepID=A0A1G6P0E8_9RHOB|nr:Phosphotransferase enzyme family protein [Ruegeria marina]